MRENGVVTSLNTLPRTTFTNVQFQPSVYPSAITTSNIAPVKSTIVNTPIQQRLITTGLTFVPPPKNVTSTFVSPNQMIGSKVVAPVQNIVKKSSVVNFNNVGGPINQLPVKKVVSQVPSQQVISQFPVHPVINKVAVQQVLNQVPISQSQVQQTIRPPIQQIIRQGPNQQNVVFGNKSIVVPVQLQQRAVETQILPQNQVIVSNIP
jgi:hypothetical protein